MTLEPHKIESGFIKRFFKNSVKLIFKDLTAWVSYVAIVFVVSYGINSFYELMSTTTNSQSNLYLPMISKIMVGIWLFFLGLEVAAQVDYKMYNQSGIFNVIKISLKHSFYYIKDSLGYILTLILVLAIISFAFFSGATEKKVVEVGTYDIIFDVIILMNHFLFWGFLVAGHSQGFFAYPLVRQFSLESYAEAKILSRKGMMINQELSAFKNLGMPIFILIAPLLTLVVLLPLVIPLVSIFVYLAFREVFLNKKETEKEEVFVMEGKLQTIGVDK